MKVWDDCLDVTMRPARLAGVRGTNDSFLSRLKFFAYYFIKDYNHKHRALTFYVVKAEDLFVVLPISLSRR